MCSALIRPVWLASVALLFLNVLHVAAAQVPSGAQGDELTLAAALQRVDQANRDVVVAHQAVDAAQSDRVSAEVTPPAQLSFNSTSINPENRGHGSYWNRPIDTILRVDQPLERGDKVLHRVHVAQAGLEAAQQDAADIARQQRVAVAQAYWDLKLAQEQLRIAQANLALAQRSSSAAQTRLAQGDLSKLEATRLSVEAGRAANEVAQASSEREQARDVVLQLLAEEGRRDIAASDPWPALSAAPDQAGEPDDAWLASRPDVQAAQRRVEQARAALVLAQAQRKADVTVGVQYEHNPPVGNTLWGFGVSIPLGMAGRQVGPEAHAVAALATAETQLDKVRAAALVERAHWRSVVKAAQERLQRLERDILPQAQEAAHAAEFARQQGALGLQDVLDARRALHATELDTVTAHADLAKALAGLGQLPHSD